MDDVAEKLIERAQKRRAEFEDQFKSVMAGIYGSEDFQRFMSKKDKDEEKENQNKASLSKAAHERLQKLSALYSEDKPGPSSPIHKIHDIELSPVRSEKRKDRLTVARSKRLASLADEINNWQDESDKKAQLKTPQVIKTKPILKDSTPPSQATRFTRPDGTKTTPKKVGWDNNMIQTLEAQGFQRCDSQQHLVFDYKSPKQSPAKCSAIDRIKSPHCSPVKNSAVSPIKPVSPVKTTVKTPVKETAISPKKLSPAKKFNSPSTAVLEMAAKYEGSPSKMVKDPTELSIMERKALFERNKGVAILPKVPFGTPVPAKVLQKIPKTNAQVASESGKEWQKVYNENGVNDIIAQSKLERERELEELRHRWDKKRISDVPLESNKTSQSSQPMSPTASSPKKIKMGTLSPVGSMQMENISPIEIDPKSPRKSGDFVLPKPIKVSPPKAGRLYPSVSDIETESEYMESEIENDGESYRSDSTDESIMSFGQAIVRTSRTSLKRASSPIESILSSDDTSAQEEKIINEMDDFLDEALGKASPPKRVKDDSIESEAPREELAKVVTPLIHTVSMYRKKEAQTTPVRPKSYVDIEIDNDDDVEDKISEEELVKNRIKALEKEMTMQTMIISQATQALNVCQSKIEFSGSQEQIEAERLLLLATSRRTAAVREMERLKVEKTLKGGIQGCEKGDLTIEKISLPLKLMSSTPDKIDHYVILASTGTCVQATPCMTANRRDTKLVFTKPLKFEGLYHDFTVNIEVYRMTTGSTNDLIPHDVKYGLLHMSDKKKLKLTPQKKSSKMRVESPAGPNAIRSPSFHINGFAVFSLREVNRNKFTLNKVPYGSQLEGNLEIQMTTQLKLNLEHKGFLTLFEEISGFGAWKRRWAVLSASAISLWAYPEHEAEKIPLDTIDLSCCTNKEVGLVSREICARPHTFQVNFVGNKRYLMSADSIEDRVSWCKAINKSIQLLAAWGTKS